MLLAADLLLLGNRYIKTLLHDRSEGKRASNIYSMKFVQRACCERDGRCGVSAYRVLCASGNRLLPGVIEKTWDKALSDNKMNRTLCEFMTASSGTDLSDFYILQVYF